MTRRIKPWHLFLLLPVLVMSAWAQTPNECEQAILSDKRFVVLHGKVDLLNSANQTTAILANSKKPLPAEKAAISDWIEEIKRCSAPGIEYHRQHSAEVASIFERAYLELYVSAAELYAGNITYGKFAQDSVRRHTAVREQISAVIAKFNAQQVEATEREAAATKQEQRRRQDQKRENCSALQQSIDNLSRTNNAIAVEAQRITSANEAMRQQRQLELSRMTPLQQSQHGMQEAGANLGAALMGGTQNPLAILDQQYRQNKQNIQSQQATYQRECIGD